MDLQFQVTKEVEISSPPDELVTYAQVARVVVSAEDAMIHFGIRNESNPQTATGVAKIYLTLPHMKRLAAALARTLDSYEKAFGPIEIEASNLLNPEIKKQLGLFDKERGEG